MDAILPVRIQAIAGSVVGALLVITCGLIVGALQWTSGTAHAQSVCPDVATTPTFLIVYGSVTLDGPSVPAETIVLARNPRGDVVGCFETHTTGLYGAMFVYGEDTSVDPLIPGMRSGEALQFEVAGHPAAADPALTWENDRDLHRVDLSGSTSATPAPTPTGLPTATAIPSPDPTATDVPSPTSSPSPTATGTPTPGGTPGPQYQFLPYIR